MHRGAKGQQEFLADSLRLLNVERMISRILLDASDTHHALEAAIMTLCESEGWDSGIYWARDADRGVMRYHAGWCVADPAIELLSREARDLVFTQGNGLVGRVWLDGEPLWVEDIASEAHVLRKDIPERTGWKNALLFPVKAEGETIGVLDFNARRIPRPEAQVLELIRVLGTQIGNFCARTEALEKLRESEQRYYSTVELAAIGISHVDPAGRFIHVNQQLCEMLAYSREELLGRTVKEISHPEDQDVTDEFRDRLRSGEIESFKVEKRYLRKDGSVIWVRLSVTEKRDREGAALYDISVVEDISARKKAEEEVHYLATHDRMTGLPNRTLFSEILGQSIKSAKRQRRSLAVLFIDLDRFKQINDSLGHEAGDLLLAEIARRFRAALRANDVVARLGGDEFVVMLEDIEDKEQAAVVARNLIAATIRPIEVLGQECRITASIGIAVHPADGVDESLLLKNADLAMYLAKEEGKNNYQFYSRDIKPQAVEKILLEARLRRALERKEFHLHYQARIDIGSGEIRGVEALLRWQNDELGDIPPGQFIPLAEESGLILPIGRWVLKSACEQGVAWQREGLPPVAISVNLSPRQFSDPELLPFIRKVLEESGLEPVLLELEITESMVMHNASRAVQKLREIKALGVKIAIDDFGTGYSSLSQLKRFPVDILKVDRSFIRELPRDEEDKAITRAIIAMGKTLGLTVVAEGVETVEQLRFLRESACDEMQGFYFSKPAPAANLAALLQRQLSEAEEE